MVGVGVLVGDMVGVGDGVLVGDGVVVGDMVGVGDGVLVGAVVKVGLGASKDTDAASGVATGRALSPQPCAHARSASAAIAKQALTTILDVIPSFIIIYRPMPARTAEDRGDRSRLSCLLTPWERIR